MSVKDNNEREEYKRRWSRGRVLWITNPQSLGREFHNTHYWLLISRNDINWNTGTPIIAVPLVSHRPRTNRYADDIEVKKEDSPTGRAMLVQCGSFKELDRVIRKVTPIDTMYCENGVMELIEEKIIEVLGMDTRWARI